MVELISEMNEMMIVRRNKPKKGLKIVKKASSPS